MFKGSITRLERRTDYDGCLMPTVATPEALYRLVQRDFRGIHFPTHSLNQVVRVHLPEMTARLAQNHHGEIRERRLLKRRNWHFVPPKTHANDTRTSGR